MSTVAQVAEIVAPFLQRHPNFVLLGRSLVMPPVGHLMFSYFIDRASEKAYISPFWVINTLFSPPPGYAGGFFLHMVGGPLDTPRTQTRLLEDMEQSYVDVALKATSLDMLFELEGQAFMPMHPLTRGTVLVALGRLPEAELVLAKHVTFLQALYASKAAALKDPRRYRVGSRSWQRDTAQQVSGVAHLMAVQELHTLVQADDRAALGALLQRWQVEAVRKKEVEHLWQPSPFPIELGVGV